MNNTLPPFHDATRHAAPGSVRARLLIVTVLLFATVGLTSADEARNRQSLVVPVDGIPFPAQLEEVVSFDDIRFRSNEEIKQYSAAELVRWGNPVEVAQGMQILLRDGSRLIGTLAGSDAEQLSVETIRFGPRQIRLDEIASIVVQPGTSPARRDRILTDLSASSTRGDRIFLRNGDRLGGTILRVSELAVEFDSEVGELEVPLDNVAALSFDPSLGEPFDSTDLRLMIGFGDGNQLLVSQLTSSEESVQLVRLDGTSWETDPGAIVWLQSFGGRAVYLSDLQPAAYKHVSFLDLRWPFAADRNVVGGRLRCGGETYIKGLGMHSASRLAFKLDRPCLRFQAEVALDESAGRLGSVVFRVFVGREQRYASPIVRGGEPPVPVSVDLTGAGNVSLIVDFADRADELDRANWLDARLIRQ